MDLKLTETITKDFTAPAFERKHIILMDGTWNDETGSNLDGLVTNIAHLQTIFVNNEEKQIVRYHRGVGNDDDNGWLGNQYQGASGRGVLKIVNDAYARFVRDWTNGDRIYIFGFSRGAAAARLLANKIDKLGIPKSITITYLPRENKETKVVEQHLAKYHIAKTENPLKVDVEFLGVWDTVSAFGIFNVVNRFMGWKTNDLFTDNHIADNIKKAVHLVAIDETRNPFVPSLMNHKEGVTHEVWFPGVHSDIGGSYAEDEIAKVSLAYMLKLLTNYTKAQGLEPLIFDDENFIKYTLATTKIAHFHFHGKSLGENLRPIRVQVDGKPDKSRKPKIHRLYYDLCESHQTYAVVKKRKFEKCIKFQYMPFNVKVLLGEFTIEE